MRVSLDLLRMFALEHYPCCFDKSAMIVLREKVQQKELTPVGVMTARVRRSRVSAGELIRTLRLFERPEESRATCSSIPGNACRSSEKITKLKKAGK